MATDTLVEAGWWPDKTVQLLKPAALGETGPRADGQDTRQERQGTGQERQDSGQERQDTRQDRQDSGQERQDTR